MTSRPVAIVAPKKLIEDPEGAGCLAWLAGGAPTARRFWLDPGGSAPLGGATKPA